MINTLMRRRRKLLVKNQFLGRQANIVTSCLPKKTTRQTLTEDSQTDRVLPNINRDEPTVQL